MLPAFGRADAGCRMRSAAGFRRDGLCRRSAAGLLPVKAAEVGEGCLRGLPRGRAHSFREVATDCCCRPREVV